MPAGFEATVPLPLPARETTSVWFWPNEASTVVLVFATKLHAPVPEQAPVHPRNALPTPGVALRSTVVPAKTVTAHVPGQLIPAGLVTMPLPDSETVTVTSVPPPPAVPPPAVPLP